MLDVLSFVAVSAVIYLARGQTIKSASACYGDSNIDCGFLQLDCGEGSRIRLLTKKYGVKLNDCKSGKRCQNNNGCCAYNSGDCFEYYSRLHKYNLYTQCSWRQRCGPIQAPNNILTACNNKPSTYVYIEYECVPESTLLPFCGNTSATASEINLVFDGSAELYETMAKCDCFVFPPSGTEVEMHVEDLRMFTRETSGAGSDCSSAILTDISHSFQFPACTSVSGEEDNFNSDGFKTFADQPFGFQLSSLFAKGTKDRPWMIWLSLSSTDGRDIFVTCVRSHNDTAPATTPVLVTTTHQTGSTHSSNGTKDAEKDEGGSSAAIVAGVLVAVVILVGLVVGFFIFKRMRKGKKEQGTARPNTYTSDTGIQEEPYAEIGYVGDSLEPPIYDPVYEPPIYDTVYESRNTESVDAPAPERNGHLNQTQTPLPTLAPQLPITTDKRPSKNPLRMISSQTDRFFAWFRNRQESSKPAGKDRGRESSYDHIHKDSPVVVTVTSSENNEGHVYSHQNHRPSLDNPIETTPTGGRISKDMSALQLEDSYIGFTFDKIDEDDPQLLKKKNVENTPRPVPPTRPAPSPNNTPRNSPTPSCPLISDSPKTARQKSPMRLSPLAGIESKERPTYDYAESQPNSRRESDASKSDMSDHSYKVLEKEVLYDYADMDEGEKPVVPNTTTNESGSSVYEDVDAKLRAESMKKHKSSADLPEYVGGYEVPVSSQNRPVSNPEPKKTGTPNIEDIGSSVISKLNKELIEKNKLKPLKPPTGGKISPKLGAKVEGAKLNIDSAKHKKVNVQGKQVIPASVPSAKASPNANPNLVKSDNVKAKDYERTEEIKGVLNMAKIFESKA